MKVMGITTMQTPSQHDKTVFVKVSHTRVDSIVPQYHQVGSNVPAQISVAKAHFYIGFRDLGLIG